MYLEIVMIASLVILNTTFVKKYLPELRLNLYMLTKGRKAIGRVEGCNSKIDSDGQEFFQTEISFVDEKNNERVFLTNFDFSSKPVVGSKAMVAYDPNDSARAIFFKRGLAISSFLQIILYFMLNVIILNYYFKWI